MRRSLILGIVLVVLVLVFYVYNYSEGFETLEDKIQDRTNTLAGQQNPIMNPAVSIGISEADGATLRGMSQTALNVQASVPDGAGSLKQAMPANTVSPRSDNENSYLGLIKMCKEKGVGETPFSDSAFNESCGMCITSGRLKTGEDFNTPTGVLVYREDKNDAIARKAKNGYIFNRAMPSVDSAICDGASKDDNAIPVLAINQEDYDAFRKRKVCRDGHKIGEQCGRCIADNESTWISPSGGKQPFTLYLWGSGKATVSLGTGFKSDELSLSGSSTKIPLGKVEEGKSIQISVLKEGGDGPYLYGVLVSPTAAKGIYQLPIEKFIERDTVSGSAPRRNGVKYFEDVKVFCTKLMSQGNKDSMNLSGFIPMTLVEADELAAFDCPSAPLVQTEGGAEFLIDDPCLKPKGQGPGNYSEECIRQTILQGGCSTNGDWYKNPPKNITSLSEYLINIRASVPLVKTDPVIAMGCKGINITTPCDAYLNGGIPNKQCLEFLYRNNSEGTRVGRAYKNADTKYASMLGNNIAFCRPEGSLNPGTSPDAVATLQSIAGGYKGVSGIEAVKMYLSDVFMKAVGSLDANVDDDKGGRKTSWQKCIGMKIADVSVPDVTTNSTNDVIDRGDDTTPTCFPFTHTPDSSSPLYINLDKTRGQVIGEFIMPKNFTLSFKSKAVDRPHYFHDPTLLRIDDADPSKDHSFNNLLAISLVEGRKISIHLRGIWFRTEDLGLEHFSFRLECREDVVTAVVNNKVFTHRFHNDTGDRSKRTITNVLDTNGNTIVLKNYGHKVKVTAGFKGGIHTNYLYDVTILNLCFTKDSSPPSVYSCVNEKGPEADRIGSWQNTDYESKMTEEQAKTTCDAIPGCASYTIALDTDNRKYITLFKKSSFRSRYPINKDFKFCTKNS